MNKYLIILFLTPLLAIADHEPESSNYTSKNISLRFFKKLANQTLLLDIESGESYNQTSSKIKIGSYYKIKDGQKLGYFISSNTGLRHTDDWIKTNSTPSWKWKDSSQRREEIIHLSYANRFVPYFDMPLVLDTKAEIQYNLFNNESQVILKPSANYFFLKSSIPKYSVHFTTPVQVPLNFEENTINRIGYYLSGIYHYSSRFQIALNYEFYSEIWTDSEDTKELHPDDSYEVTNSVGTTKLEFIFHF